MRLALPRRTAAEVPPDVRLEKTVQRIEASVQRLTAAIAKDRQDGSEDPDDRP